MKTFKLLAAALILLLAGLLALVGQPNAQDMLYKQRERLEKLVVEDSARLDPGELYDLMLNNQVRLVLLDMRCEADYNLFHLHDARLTREQDLAAERFSQLPAEAIIITYSNDEAAALNAWMLLAAQHVPNCYYLGGGINFWLHVYRDGALDASLPPANAGNDVLRGSFTMALGADQPAAAPDQLHLINRSYEAKVKMQSAAKKPGGGCG